MGFVYFIVCLAAVLLCALVVLLIVAALRAVLIKAKPDSGESAVGYTPEECESYAEQLSEMIKIPTVSARKGEDLTEFYRLHEVMKESFPLVHSTLERFETDGNLLYRWRGEDSSHAILFMGHQDVVPADGEQWEHEPFSGDIDNEVIHGRGAMDCKCTVMAEFAAVEELIRDGFVPRCDVYLSSSVNEEISGGGATQIVEYLQKNGIRLDFVLDEGGAIVEDMMPGMTGRCAAIGTVEKGHTNIKFIARGHGGHSSTPPKNSPLARLAGFVNEVEKKRPFKSKITQPVEQMFTSLAPSLSFPMRMLLGNVKLFRPLLTAVLPKVSPQAAAFVQTTFAFTMCGGSQAENVIPNEAYVICNIRPTIHQNSEESVAVLRKIAEKYDIETQVMRSCDASNITSTGSEQYKYIMQCVKDCFPGVARTPYYMCGGTDCRNYEPVSDNCLRFSPLMLTKQQLASMHAANENVGKAALAQSVKFYRYVIENYKI